jgi:hypothetical protein
MGRVRVTGAATAVTWIPSEAVTGALLRKPFDLGLSHYDDPPPDSIADLDALVAADRCRFANHLDAWIDVEDGKVVDHGHNGRSLLGATTLRLGPQALTFAAVAMPDKRSATPLGDDAVRFEQTAGGRTGVPAPRHVVRPPYVQFYAPLAWSSLALTLYADGRREFELTGASPFPRHWVYDGDGRLHSKSATIDYHEWSTTAYGAMTPWGENDSPAVVHEVESALERQLSRRLMGTGERPRIERYAAGDVVLEQGSTSDDLLLILDGVLSVAVDGRPLAELAPGAVLGERAGLEGGVRTATLTAVTPSVIARTSSSILSVEERTQLAEGHRREDLAGGEPTG